MNGDDLVSQFDEDFFSEFIQQITPHIRQMIHELVASSSSASESETKFLRLFFPEMRIETDRKLGSITKVVAVLIYDILNIGLKTLEYTDESLGQNLLRIGISKISKRITKSNLDIPLFHSSIFPLQAIIELFVSNSKIFDTCVKYFHQDTHKLMNYSQMKLPYYFDRSIGQQKKQMLGQVFTPISIVDFISNQVISSETEIIIDPAAGTGVFLLRALKNSFDLKYQVRKVIAIEKDPLLSLICESAIIVFCKFRFQTTKCQVYNQDLFTTSSILKELHHEKNGAITILMNPPYTRQELIPATEKRFIRNCVSSTDIITNFRKRNTSFRISGQSSLYIYFLLFISEFLKPNDRMGLIIPNSWMDVKYGSMLQLFLLEHFYIDLIVSSRLEKLIPSVDVNTAIMTLQFKSERQRLELRSSSHQVKFIWINSKDNLKQITSFGIQKAISMSEGAAFVPIKEGKLLLEPKWGVFAKAPSAYLEFLEKADSDMKYLKDYTSVRRGFTTGANDFFYLGKPGKMNKFFVSRVDPKDASLVLKPKNKELQSVLNEQGFLLKEETFVIEREYWMHQILNEDVEPNEPISHITSRNEVWVPNYLIKSPKELKGFKVTNDLLNYIVLIVPKKKSSELKPGIRKYIRWGETWRPIKGNSYALRTTCLNRKYWYSLPVEYYRSCPILCIMTINDRYPFFYNPHNYYFDARLYGITPRTGVLIGKQDLTEFLLLYLNTIFVSIQIELLGRRNLGEGGLDVKVYEYQEIKIPSFNFSENRLEYSALFEKVMKSKPSSYIKTGHPTSKRILDLFLKQIYSFADNDLEIMHKALQRIVQARIDKAKTDFSYLR
jgi:type I restriction-modification system DNA methylase subunit